MTPVLPKPKLSSTDRQLIRKKYPMCLQWFNDVRDFAYLENEHLFPPDQQWRRAFVEQLYHALRAEGASHEQAFSDLAQYIPRISLDAEGFAQLD